ncbi:hypothetical protein JOD97_003276 [Duganella sp. 1411]|uniref:hypothetical protein n=1 Tax=Duganella sp. 1411 TaxID=2806572 RepID=UPI001AE93C98|nr:hypothetical protein [Duganella sp. 1411]MBP1205234.1 hypothetical protein [Duganella sp. 1411]
MKHICLLLVTGALALDGHARMPSKVATVSCLAAQAMSSSVKWQPISTAEIYSEDDYKDGFNATYFIILNGKQVGYAERGEDKAILYGDEIFLVARARMLPGFDVRPTELNPFLADWATVTDGSGSYLCVSFPFGDLGQSGSFQKNRSAYLMAIGHGKGRRVLYAAGGNIDLLLK